MNLLTKSQIDEQKSQERKTEIDEGAKLARRVDALREITAEEEARLEKFRVETVAQIQTEIDQEISKRDTLKLEVSDLECARALALIPIDEKWIAVNEKEQQLKEDEVVIESKLAEAEIIHSYHVNKAREIEIEEQRLRDKQAQIYELAQATVLKSQQVEVYCSERFEHHALIESLLDQKTIDLENWEERNTARENLLKIREEKVAKDLIEIAIREKQIKDKVETFERSVSRA